MAFYIGLACKESERAQSINSLTVHVEGTEVHLVFLR